MSEAALGVVLIGRNEGERLRACLRSVCHGARPVVYVDSASSDGSVELARSFGAEVVELDMSQPFSAARARNAGFERLRALSPGIRYVQFVDGDCEVVAGWFDAAIAALEAHPDVAVVCGRRRERHPEKSVYNALCDVEWDTPVGEAEACGGDAMMRADALLAVGGYDPSIVAGEEPELCIRLRARGHRVLRIADEMTLHDAAMLRFAQWWKRTVRSGHAHAELAYLHADAPGRPGVRQTISNFFWAGGVPAGIGLALRLSPASALGAAVYPWLAARIYRRELEQGRTHEQALMYAVACTIGKFPETLGALRFWYGALTGKRSKIIEYKQPEPNTRAEQ